MEKNFIILFNGKPLDKENRIGIAIESENSEDACKKALDDARKMITVVETMECINVETTLSNKNYTFLDTEGREGIEEEEYEFSVFLNGEPTEHGIAVNAKNLEEACYKAAEEVKNPVYGKGASTRFGIWCNAPIKEPKKE